MKNLLSVLALTLFTMTPAAAGDGGDYDAIFTTPSKNIYCEYASAEGVLICERHQPKYVSFHFLGHHTELTKERREIRNTFRHSPGAFVLGYGKSWRSDQNIKCTSKPSGLTCIFTTIEPGSGITISKSGLKLFK